MKLSDLLNNTTTKRDALKPAFNTGEIPTQQNFNELIDDLFLIQGDTLYKDATSGLGIQAGTDAAKSVLHFYDDPTQEPAWSIGIQNGFELKDTTGASRLLITPTGQVAIGTNALEGKKLLISGESRFRGLVDIWGDHNEDIESSWLYNLTLVNNQNIDNTFTRLFFSSDSSGLGAIGVNRISEFQGDLHFQTRNGPGYLTTKMFIKHNGTVGIGTTTPNYTLTLNDATGGGGLIEMRRGTGTARFLMDNNKDHIYITTGTSSATNGLFIHSTGNVGVGTTSPSEKLHVNGSIIIPSASNTSNHGLIAVSNDYFFYDSKRISNYGVGFYGYTGSAISGGINTYVSGHFGIDFFTAGAHQMRIERGGAVGIGTKNPNYRLHVYSSTESWLGVETPSGTNNVGILLKKANYTWQMYQPANSNNLNFWNSSNSVVGELTPGGNLHLRGQVGSLSDGRFKQNIQPISSNAIAKLTQLQGATYQWRTEEGQDFDEGTYIGFIAQEMKKLYPDLVSENQDGHLSINYTGLIPIIVEANKQQQQRIEDLQTQVANLTAIVSNINQA
ncbi:MAG TPA: hypothetical protein DCS93_36595 [Microscillaceae bacterium]|nr:hypothetical protein [Microscillaceae bacterium]